LAAGTYHYKVSAVSSAGESQQSGSASATVSGGSGALSLSNAPGAYGVFVTSSTLNSNSTPIEVFSGGTSNFKAYGVGNGGSAGLEWSSASDMSGSYNVMIVTETGAKYQNNVSFSNGSASLNWNSMAAASMEKCGILTLSNAPSDPYGVFVTEATLSDTLSDLSIFNDVVANCKAYSSGSGGFGILEWNSVSDMSDSYSVLIATRTEARYANGISFSNGSGSLNWNSMSPISRGGGGNSGRTLIITDITAVQAGQGQSGFMVGIFQAGTTPEDAFSQKGFVTGADNEGVKLSSSAPYTATVSLSDLPDGTYDIYLMLGSESSASYYRKQNVQFTSALTSVSATAFSPLQQ
jgi:hypothetical protein